MGFKLKSMVLQCASSLELAAAKIRCLHHSLPAEYTDISAFAFRAWVRRPPSFWPLRDIERIRSAMPCSVPQAAIRLY